jgi:AcrR family transcriptional regulator
MSAIVSFLSHFIASGVSIPFVAEARGETALGLRERKKQRTRTTLIDAAVELCDRQGFERTTVDQIAAIADVSPRTFSRYFATKDAIALALIDEILGLAAEELASQPADISHFDALHRSYVSIANSAKCAPAGGLTADRLMCIVRIIVSSTTLRQVAVEYRASVIDAVLAERMGVSLDDRRLKLVSAVWGSIVMTALTDVADQTTDPGQLGIDEVVARLEVTFAEFAAEVERVRLPV